jgi:hypothetical protein
MLWTADLAANSAELSGDIHTWRALEAGCAAEPRRT